MNKQELLLELAVKFYKLGKVTPVELSSVDTLIREEEKVKWYIAGVYEKADNRLIRKNISFYVEKEGETTEAAFYAEKDPVNSLSTEPNTPFKDLVKAEINKKISEGLALKGIIESVNETEKFAFVTIYALVVSEVNIQNYFAYNDTEAKLQFTKIKGE